MKNSFKLFVTLFILAFAFNVNAQLPPTYTLEIKNGVFAPDLTSATFDIVVTHTDATLFEYAGGQYFLTIPQTFGDIALGAATAGGGYRYDSVAGTHVSNFPPPPAFQFIPRNPSVVLETIDGISFYELRLAANPLPGAGNGFIMPQGIPILIIRMKIIAQTGVLDPANGNLVIRDSCAPGPLSVTRTKINAYIGTENTEITRCANHSVDGGGALPVELASFSAAVNRNNVNLNWATATENNNQGFDVERKLVTATDWTRVGNVVGSGTTTEQKNYNFSDRTSTGKYNYRLKQIDLNGNFAYHPLANEVIVGVPSTYNLSQNYPNPFNPTTKVDYDLPHDGQVSIKLFDISGREVANLVNEVKTAGYYTLQFNASNLASGLYFYRITAQGNSNNFVQTKKMVLVK